MRLLPLLLIVLLLSGLVDASKSSKSSKSKSKHKSSKIKSSRQKNKDDDFKHHKDAKAWSKYLEKQHKRGKNKKMAPSTADEMWKEWKVAATDYMKTNRNARFVARRQLEPYIVLKNKYASPDVCTELEYEKSDQRLITLFNGILRSRGFKEIQFRVDAQRKEQYYKPGHLRNRQLQRTDEGEDRELWLDRCLGARFSWICRGYGRYNRRRLGTDDSEYFDPYDEIAAIQETAPDILETVMVEVKSALEDQCKRLLFLIGLTSPRFQHGCRDALRNSLCSVEFDLSDAAALKLSNKNA